MEITNEQKQVMLSGLLGDGHVSTHRISYNCMYEEYMHYKNNLLGDLAKSKVQEKENLGFKKGSKIYNFSIGRNEYVDYLMNTPLSTTINDLDELGLALWIMDDGSLHKKSYFYNINTHSFSREDEENILIPKLNSFGIFPQILTETKKDGRVFSYLYISKWNGAMIISRILRKYMVECYSYKLIPKEIEDAYFRLDLDIFSSLPSEFARTKYLLRENGVKVLSDLLINNTKGKEYTYTELTKVWNSKFSNPDIIFCMYDWKDEDTDIVIPSVNFLDENPIVKGSFKLSFNTWKYGKMLFYVEGRSLTWKLLVNILCDHNDGHHIFLESIDIQNNNEVSVFLGS